MSQLNSLDRFMLSPRATNSSVRSLFTSSKVRQSSRFTNEYLHPTNRKEQLPVDFDELSKDSRFQDDISVFTPGGDGFRVKHQGKRDTLKKPKRASLPNHALLGRAASARGMLQSQSPHAPSPFRESKIAKLLIEHGFTIDLDDDANVPVTSPKASRPKGPKSPSRSKRNMAKSMSVSALHVNNSAVKTMQRSPKKGESSPRRAQSERRLSSCGTVSKRNSNYTSQASFKRSPNKPNKQLPEFEKLWDEENVPEKMESEMKKVAADDVKKNEAGESQTDITESETEVDSFDGEESHDTAPFEIKEATHQETNSESVHGRRLSKRQLMKLRLQNIESRFTDVLGKLNSVADRLRKVNEDFRDTLATSTHSSDSSLTVCSAEVEPQRQIRRGRKRLPNSPETNSVALRRADSLRSYDTFAC